MNHDLLEQLAELEVPPPPTEFDRRVHERVNGMLLVQHLVDFALGALPWALVHFVRGVLASLVFTVTGRFDEPAEPRN